MTLGGWVATALLYAFGRWRGLTSLAGLAVSFAVLLFFIIPAIVRGSPPLLVAVVGASAIMFAALYLTHGVNLETSVAIAGTLASLVLTGVLGLLAGLSAFVPPLDVTPPLMNLCALGFLITVGVRRGR